MVRRKSVTDYIERIAELRQREIKKPYSIIRKAS